MPVRGPLPPADRLRVVRPLGARGAGLRRSRPRLRRRRAARGRRARRDGVPARASATSRASRRTGRSLLLDDAALRGRWRAASRERAIDALRRGRDRVALPRAVRERPRRGLTGGGRAARELSPRSRPTTAARRNSPRERRPEEAGIVRRERHGHAGREERAERVRRAAGDGARPEVRRRADVADDAALRERAEERRVLGRPDAVRDAHGLKDSASASATESGPAHSPACTTGMRPTPAPAERRRAKSRAGNAVSSPPRPKPPTRGHGLSSWRSRTRSADSGPQCLHEVEEDDDAPAAAPLRARARRSRARPARRTSRGRASRRRPARRRPRPSGCSPARGAPTRPRATSA